VFSVDASKTQNGSSRVKAVVVIERVRQKFCIHFFSEYALFVTSEDAYTMKKELTEKRIRKRKGKEKLKK